MTDTRLIKGLVLDHGARHPAGASLGLTGRASQDAVWPFLFGLGPGGAGNFAQDMPKRLENCAMLRILRTDSDLSEFHETTTKLSTKLDSYF